MSKILVIDDTPTILAFCVAQLPGHEVHTATDWIEANRIAHAVKPDLIVLDENLGSFQGSFLVRAFRMFFGPSLPLVTISSADVAESAKAAGANAFLPKEQLVALSGLVDVMLACSAGGACAACVGLSGAVACNLPACAARGMA